MSRARAVWIVAGLAVAAAFAALQAHAGPKEKPFPAEKTTMLDEDGMTYVVEGRLRIPKGVQISVQKDTKLVGRGTESVLVVEGTLMIHGVTGKEVVVENVWIECQEKFESLHVDMTKFRGLGGVRTQPGKAVDGRFFIENCKFDRPTTVTGTFLANEIDVQDSTLQDKMVLKAVVPEGTKGNKAQLMLHMGDFQGGLVVEGFSDVTVRAATLRGRQCIFKDNLRFVLDACAISAGELEIRQSAPGRFKDARMEKCNVTTARITLFAPLKKDLNEMLSIDKCWFEGITAEKELREKVFKDGDDDPAKNGVRAKFLKIADKPLVAAPSVR